MQILSIRSKVSLRRFYGSFTFNKQCKSYVRDISSLFSDEFHEKHQRLFLLISPRTQEFVDLSRQCKLPVDPYLNDRQVRLDIDID
jgi:hypothetical protein